MSGRGEIYIEMLPLGNAIEVVAIDGETGREVRFVAPKTASEAEIKSLARAKLEYVQRKSNSDDVKPPRDSRGGIIV